MKTKKFYRIIAIFCVLVTLGVVGINTMNYNVIAATTETDDYKTFAQNDSDWADTILIGSSTVGNSGCYLTSLCIQLAYANPELRNRATFNPGIAAEKVSFNSEGNFVWSSMGNIDPKFTRVDYESLPLGDSDAVIKKCKELEDEGYYVLLEDINPVAVGNQHWSPVTGFEDGKPYIYDVNQNADGSPRSSVDEWLKYCVGVQYWQYEGVPSYEAHKARTNGSSSNGSENVTKTDRIQEGINLVGMGEYQDYLAEGRENVSLVDNSYLSKSEQNKLAETKTNMSATTRNVLGWFSVLSKFVGIILMVYSMLLLIAMIIDKINVWVDVKLTKVLSFGIWELYTDDDIDIGSGNKRLLSMKQLGIKIVIIFLIGMTLLTTIPLKIYVLLYKIW